MSTARNIIKNRIKAGNTVLGVGCYSAAIESTSDNKIIKVGNTTDDPWLYYYEEVIKPQLAVGNPHVPVVHDIHIDHGHDYYVAVIEKLYKHEERDHGDLSGADALEECIVECAEANIDYYSWAGRLMEREAHDCYGEFNASRLYDVLAGVRACKDNSIQLGCNEECEDGECDCSWESLSVDLHSDNIMYRRDGTVVINDPLCDTDMDEVDDLSNWADEMEIVE